MDVPRTIDLYSRLCSCFWSVFESDRTISDGPILLAGTRFDGEVSKCSDLMAAAVRAAAWPFHGFQEPAQAPMRLY